MTTGVWLPEKEWRYRLLDEKSEGKEIMDYLQLKAKVIENENVGGTWVTQSDG